MKKCKICSKDYEVGIKDFCSDECFKEDIKKRVKIATENDTSHTRKISRDFP